MLELSYREEIMRIANIRPNININTSFGQIKLGSHVPIDFVLRDVTKKDDYVKLKNLIEQEDKNDCDILLTHVEKVDGEIIDDDLLSGKPFKYLRNCKIEAEVGNQTFKQNFCTSPFEVIEKACKYAQKIKNNPLLRHEQRNNLTKESLGYFKRQTNNFRTVIELLAESEPDKKKGRFSQEIREELAKMADQS